MGFADEQGRSRTESLGERVLGSLLDRAHLMPARLVGPLVAQEIAAVGGTDVSIWLQDYDQRTLQPLTGRGLVGGTTPIDGSWPGPRLHPGRPHRAGAARRVACGCTCRCSTAPTGSASWRSPSPAVDDNDRRLAQRLAGLTADLIVTKSLYTGTFARVRAAAPMSLSAHLQWQTLPPLVMTTPDVALAGILEPAYDVGGDSFDYALNDHVLHLAVFDAMGHGLEAAIDGHHRGRRLPARPAVRRVAAGPLRAHGRRPRRVPTRAGSPPPRWAGWTPRPACSAG